MALAPSQPLNYLNGYPATLGGKVIRICWVKGTTSYVSGAAGGQPVYDAALRSIDHMNGGISLSGNYVVLCQPHNMGPNVAPNAWVLRWFAISGMAEVSNSTDLSGEKVQIKIIGG